MREINTISPRDFTIDEGRDRLYERQQEKNTLPYEEAECIQPNPKIIDLDEGRPSIIYPLAEAKEKPLQH